MLICDEQHKRWCRWISQDPVPPDPWTEPPRQYIRGGCMAPQLYAANKIVIGNEDCLRLRIYTRSLKPKRLKPVMVWIHGGSFVHGSVSADIYNPEYLLREKIVLVAISYRLGALGECFKRNYLSARFYLSICWWFAGFLLFKDPGLAIPGNAGLKDQVMAMKWVKANIQFFGGDPENISKLHNKLSSRTIKIRNGIYIYWMSVSAIWPRRRWGFHTFALCVTDVGWPVPQGHHVIGKYLQWMGNKWREKSHTRASQRVGLERNERRKRHVRCDP